MATTTKSAIREVREQLFLDTADGEYLTALSSNYGVTRPKLGMSDDDLWRAIVRQLALDYKQIITVFHELLTILLGPQHPVGMSLSAPAAIGATDLYVYSWELLPQKGTLILDYGLPTQETVVYSFCDPVDGHVYLDTALLFNHTVRGSRAFSYLASNAVAPTGSLTLEEGLSFPNPAVVGSYPVLIESESRTNELVVCSVKAGNVLTTTNTINNHYGPSSGFAVTPVTAISADLMLIFGSNVLAFDHQGILFIQQSGGTPSEYVSYSSLDAINKVFNLKSKLQNTYVATSSYITKASHGASVQIAQVLVQGVNWEVFQTEEHVIKLLIPSSIVQNRLVDAPYLHDRVVTPPSTTLAANANIGDRSITVSNASLFPSAGLLQIPLPTLEYISYSRINRFTATLQSTNRSIYTTGTGDSISAPVGITQTLIDAGAAFTPSVVGMQLTIAGSASAVNNGVFTVSSYTNPTTISYSNQYGVLDAAFAGTWTLVGPPTGTGDSISAPVGVTQTLTDLQALFVPAYVGMQITVAGALAGNNGTFVITAVPGPTTISYTNAGGVIEAVFPGTWVVTGLPNGATTLYVDNAKPFWRAFYDYRLTSLIVGDGLANAETVTVSAVDIPNNSLTVTATANSHSPDEPMRMGNSNILYLDRPLVSAHVIGNAVNLHRVKHAGTQLEDGRIYTADPTRFQGKYLWSFLERLAESTKTTLAENVAGPTYVVVSQQAGRTALEVRNAKYFNTTILSEIEVGGNLASRERRQINNIHLRTSISGRTLAMNALVAGTTIQVSAGPNFPEANGYRLHIANTISGTSEEIVIVKSYDPATQIMTLAEPLVYAHNATEPVQLMADVLTIDALTNDQTGLINLSWRKTLVPLIGTEWATKQTVPILDTPASVYELRSYIRVASAASNKFVATGEYIKLNFARNKLAAKSQLTASYASGVGAVTVADGSVFPTTPPNFEIVLGEGTREAEYLTVSGRAGNILTLATNTLFPHRIDEWVYYPSGDSEEVFYTSKTTGGPEQFNFSPTTMFEDDHLSGESVTLSSQYAWPGKYGSDYPFYLTSTWEDRFAFIFDLARAAGVKVIIVYDR